MKIERVVNQIRDEIVQGIHPVTGPELLVLAGLQYSGKSFLAERIAQRNYAHFWATKTKKHYGFENPEMVEVALLVAEAALVEGFNIVIDHVNHMRCVRTRFQALVRDVGVRYPGDLSRHSRRREDAAPRAEREDWNSAWSTGNQHGTNTQVRRRARSPARR